MVGVALRTDSPFGLPIDLYSVPELPICIVKPLDSSERVTEDKFELNLVVLQLQT